MRVGNYNVVTPSVLPRMEIKSDAQALLFTVDFKGRALPLYDQVVGYLMQDFKNAVAGKINLTYSGNSTRGINSIPNKPLADMAQVFSSFGDRTFVIKKLANVSLGVDSYRAAFIIPLSHRGTLPLNEANKFVLEFEGFLDGTVIGGAAATETMIYVDTIVTPQWDNNVCRLDTIVVQPGTVNNIDVSDVNLIVIPQTLTKLLLNGENGVQWELKDNVLDSYLSTQGGQHIVAEGETAFYYNWFALPTIGYRRGTLELFSGKEAYRITSEMA